MTNNRELKNRVSSAKSTQKITQVMRLISTSYVKRISVALKNSEDALGIIRSTLQTVVTNKYIRSNPLFYRGQHVLTRLLIVITSDKGLCGHYNNSVVKACHAAIKRIVECGEDYQIVCVGNRGFRALKKQYSDKVIGCIPILHRGKMCSLSEVVSVRDRVIDMFTNNNVQAVEVIYTKFKSGLDMTVTSDSLLPIHIHNPAEDDIAHSIYDVERELVVDAMAKHFLSASIYNMLATSYMSEENSRMIAMDGAVRNTEGLIIDLNKQLNRSRQVTITNTLIDIINSSESI